MDPRYTIDAISLSGLTEKQIAFVKKLNTSNYDDQANPQESIMHYGQLCSCDDGFLCEHRLQVIVDFLKEKS